MEYALLTAKNMRRFQTRCESLVEFAVQVPVAGEPESLICNEPVSTENREAALASGSLFYQDIHNQKRVDGIISTPDINIKKFD